MPINILTNTAATHAAVNVSRASRSQQESLEKLASGSRIGKSSSDAGGLAVSVKLTAAIARSQAAKSNILSAVSYLQTQGSALQSMVGLTTRMSELVTAMADSTKNSADNDNYVAEMSNLAEQLKIIRQETFNGTNLFSFGGYDVNLKVQLTDDGSQMCEITKCDLGLLFENIVSFSNSFVTIDPFANSGGLTASAYEALIQKLATLVADNGSQVARLNFALDSLAGNQNALESANSKIADVDVAVETTRLAKASVIVETGAKMLAQANAGSQIALRLLESSSQ